MRVGIGYINGLGDTCPSMEQLQGIIDSSDPCQNGGITSLPLSTTPANSDIATLASPSTIALNSVLPVGSACVLTTGAVGTMNASGACIAAAASSNTFLYVGLAALGTMLLLGMMRK
jgi:hypothetical protein